ncbi:MAG: tetratricopeptide repeat protein [Rhodospirillales bacterium]
MADLSGRTVVFIGRLQRLPRRLAARCVVERGGSTRRSLTRATDLVVVGGGAAAWLGGERLSAKTAAAGRVGAACLSEAALLRRLGLLPPLAPETLSITADELARVGKLEPKLVALFALLDIFEGEDGRFAFTSLALARTAARLLGEGLPVADVVHGFLAARRHHGPRATALVRRPDGSIGLRWGDGVTDLSGQLRLPLAEPRTPSVDHLFEAAELANEAGEEAAAEHLFRRCVALDRRDPCAPFALGLLFRRQGRCREAKLYLSLAAALDPGFAEAWYELALLFDAEGRREQARDGYARALAADPRYGDALFNSAMLSFEAGDYPRAAELWERYLAIDAHGEWAKKARHGLAYCRRMTPVPAPE